MSVSEWKEVRLGDVILFNPSESLKKRKIAKKITMEQLAPFTRKITNYELSEFTGGSKFRNGDTLLARITPCLENGKTAYVDILSNSEVAFGSTEFIVMRNKENITDDKFIYYLAISPDFRDKAIKSMTGTSGRQRVQQDVLQSYKIILPPLPEQKAIGATLSALDDMIELNNQINKTLEEMAQAIFKSWFVDFEPFKDGEFEESELGLIPKGWRVGTLGECIDFINGYAFRSKELLDENTGECYHVFKMGHIKKGGGLNSEGTKSYIEKKKCRHLNKYVLQSGDLLMCMTDMKGNVALLGHTALMNESGKYIVNQRVGLIRVNNNFGIDYPFLYILTNSKDFIENLRGRANSGVQVNLSTKEIIASKIIIPEKSVNEKFNYIVKPYFDEVFRLIKENQILLNIRDTLLPKLMSGEIRVPVEEVV